MFSKVFRKKPIIKELTIEQKFSNSQQENQELLKENKALKQEILDKTYGFLKQSYEPDNDLKQAMSKIEDYVKEQDKQEVNGLQMGNDYIHPYIPQYINPQATEITPINDIWYSALSNTDSGSIFNQKDVNTLINYFSKKRLFPINVYDVYLTKFFQQNCIIQSIIDSYTMPLINNLFIPLFTDKRENEDNYDNCCKRTEQQNTCLNVIKKSLHKAINLAEILGGCYVVYDKNVNNFFVLTRQELLLSKDKISDTKDINSKFLSSYTNYILTLSKDKKKEILKDCKVYVKYDKSIHSIDVLPEDIFFVKGSNEFYFQPMAHTMHGFNASILEKCFDSCMSLINNINLANKLSSMNGMPCFGYKDRAKTNNTKLNDELIFARSQEELSLAKNKLLNGSNIGSLFNLDKNTELLFIDNPAFRENLESQMYSVIISIYGIPELYNNDNTSIKLFKKNNTAHISHLLEMIVENKFYSYLAILNNIVFYFLNKQQIIPDNYTQTPMKYSLKNSITARSEDIKQLLSYNSVANNQELSTQIVEKNII